MAMDKTVAESYPFLVAECKKRKLEVMAHGTTARRPIHSGMTPDVERAYIKASIARGDEGDGEGAGGLAGAGLRRVDEHAEPARGRGHPLRLRLGERRAAVHG